MGVMVDRWCISLIHSTHSSLSLIHDTPPFLSHTLHTPSPSLSYTGLGDVTNARAAFERALTMTDSTTTTATTDTTTPTDTNTDTRTPEATAQRRRIWDAYVAFEYAHGDCGSRQAVERRRVEDVGEGEGGGEGAVLALSKYRCVCVCVGLCMCVGTRLCMRVCIYVKYVLVVCLSSILLTPPLSPLHPLSHIPPSGF